MSYENRMESLLKKYSKNYSSNIVGVIDYSNNNRSLRAKRRISSSFYPATRVLNSLEFVRMNGNSHEFRYLISKIPCALVFIYARVVIGIHNTHISSLLNFCNDRVRAFKRR